MPLVEHRGDLTTSIVMSDSPKNPSYKLGYPQHIGKDLPLQSARTDYSQCSVAVPRHIPDSNSDAAPFPGLCNAPETDA